MEVLPASQINGNGIHQQETTDPSDVLEHIIKLIQANLGAARRELDAVGSLLSQSNRSLTLERCGRFATEPQVALFAQKDVQTNRANGDSHEEEEAVEEQHTYSLTSEFVSRPTTVASIAFLKRPAPLEVHRSLTSQIYPINLPGTHSNDGDEESAELGRPSAFEVLHTILHNALAPYFDAHTRNSDLAARSAYDNDAKTGIPGAKRRIAELEMSLLNLQQNTDIPLIHLPMHELVEDVIEQARIQTVQPTIQMIPTTTIENTTVQNSLTNHLNGWIKTIQTVTKLADDSECGSAAQEINFWLSLESALKRIEDELTSDGVQLTLAILKAGKRHQALLGLSEDTGLKHALDKVRNYNVLMRDFPHDELSAATSLDKIMDALHSIFSHLNKKLRLCAYPIKRALKLVEGISLDLDAQLHRIVHGRALMAMSFRDFNMTIRTINNVWGVWADMRREFTNVARDVQKRRNNNEFVVIKVKERHEETRSRLEYVDTFRRNHEQLRKTIDNVLGPTTNSYLVSSGYIKNPQYADDPDDAEAVREVTEAYDALKDVDVLDLSAQGSELWNQAEQQYIERTSRVENSIITKLRDRLATAKSANEMFRVFSKFNALLVRPKVRGAIGEYQTQLLDNVKRDISSLHERFKQQYGGSEAQMMAQLRDIPPVAGSIIWVRQIEAQLDGLMKKVEAVLGQDWTLHTDGEKIQAESTMFRKKLTTRDIFGVWLQGVQRSEITTGGRLFQINKVRGPSGQLEIQVNFDDQVVALFKEVRSLTWLGFSVPHMVSTVARNAQRIYPYALSLMESVRTYVLTVRAIQDAPTVAQLMSNYIKEAHALFATGMPLRWESLVNQYEWHQKSRARADGVTKLVDSLPVNDSAHVQYVRNLSTVTAALQEKFLTLRNTEDTIQKALSDLRTCPYEAAIFQSHFSNIQNAVDKLNLENFANLEHWVSELNLQLETVLRGRLKDAMGHWTRRFASSEQTEVIAVSDGDSEDIAHKVQFDTLDVEISMNNQTIFVDPPISYIKAAWLQHLENWLDALCGLQRIKATRYQISAANVLQQKQDFFDDLATDCLDSLEASYRAVDLKIDEMSTYLEEWYRYQSLWDLQVNHVQESLGEDLALWHQLIQEIRLARSTFDTSDVRKTFGFVTFNYEQVQSKITQKYDQWQTEITSRFGLILGNRMREVFAELKRARHDLENQSLEASSTAQAVAFITIVQQCKRNANLWEPEVEVFRQGQTTLSRQRYNFSNDWLSANQVGDEWDSFQEILARKSRVVEEQTDALCAKIVAEDRVINEKVLDIVNRWAEEKPISGEIPPSEALELLRTYENRLEKLRAETETVAKAKEALALPHNQDDTLAATAEEVQDFNSVWSALSLIWQRINELRETLWTSVQPRKLRQQLEEQVKTAKEMPSRVRQYAAFEYVQKVLKDLQRSNSILTDLKTDAIRERHWLKIYKALRPTKRYSEISLTLGDVWDLKPLATESVIRDIIAQAQGELALEEFVRQVRETWQNYSLDLVNYQNKQRLIRGWDDLFTKCSENLNSLQAMRHSPYYKEFEEEASSWEDKLNRVHVLFDIWIDVQRQWVYLEGVFSGNNDIKHLLPTESSRFNNINTEFIAVMKKVYKSPYVMDVLAIPGVQKSLDRLAELLSKIQKALGEYLERERVSFPRFYFVGDEDLLEIIGNSNDTSRVAKHFKKMFAGISGVEMNDDNAIIAITSKEGEHIDLKKEVSLIKLPKINDWLGALDISAKLTLAELLSEAITEFEPIFTADTLDTTAFQAYLDSFPAQIVISTLR